MLLFNDFQRFASQWRRSSYSTNHVRFVTRQGAAWLDNHTLYNTH